MTNMAAMPIHGKNLYKSLLLNRWIDALKFDMWHWVQEYYQDCLNKDLGLTLAYVTTRSNMDKF